MEQKVWIAMTDGRNNEDIRDLDHLNNLIWGANGNARKGDLILMYRTAPFSDIAYVFKAQSDARRTKPEDKADTSFVIRIGNKIRLGSPIKLRELKNDPIINNWSFARNQQGALRRKRDIKEEGYWQELRKLILSVNLSIKQLLASLDSSMKSRSLRPVSLIRQSPSMRVTTDNRLERLKEVDDVSKLQVFISYASEDCISVEKLFEKLSGKRRFELWMDTKKLVAGVDWKTKIANTISSVDAMIICLSPISVGKIGIVQKEIVWALEIADQQPEGTTFILPVKLEECEMQKRLSKWQCVRFPEEFNNLVAGLNERAKFLGIYR